MISLSTSAPLTWTPPWYDAESPRRYQFRAGSVADRALVEAELAGECRAASVYGF